MLPEINIFSLKLSTYGICASIGIVLMLAVAAVLGRKKRIKIEDALFGMLFSLLGAFIGAHILYALTNLSELVEYLGVYFEGNQRDGFLWDVLSTYAGGMVFYGGLIMGLLFGVLYCKFRKLNTGDFADCFAVGIPLFHAFGRIGCFLSGCCYGIESKFGFTATHAIVDSCNNVNRFPVQLLESALNLVIFATLLFLFQKGIMTKKLIFLYLIMYGTVRFFDEFLRADEIRGIYLGLSTSQWISIGLVIISVIILCVKSRRVKIKYI